jgi:hypothetical protein
LSTRERERIAELLAKGAPFWRLVRRWAGQGTRFVERCLMVTRPAVVARKHPPSCLPDKD